MGEFYYNLALLTALLALVTGTISFYAGLKSGERTYRYFAFMGLCMAAFLFLPPVGFILSDQSPYPMNLLGKRIFIFTYYALFPWFISSYTGYQKKYIPALISAWACTTYCIMFFSGSENSMTWSLFAIAGFVAILMYGIVAGMHQLRNGERPKATWFLFSIGVFGFLLLLTIMNLFATGVGIFFPLHASSIPFMIIMGARVTVELKHILGRQTS